MLLNVDVHVLLLDFILLGAIIIFVFNGFFRICLQTNGNNLYINTNQKSFFFPYIMKPLQQLLIFDKLCISTR